MCGNNVPQSHCPFSLPGLLLFCLNDCPVQPDQTLDYEGDLAGQVQRMENFTAGNPSRLTLFRTDGTMVSDSDADPAGNIKDDAVDTQRR